MRIPAFSENEFVDATGPNGLNAAFGLVSGSVSSMGSGLWALPGLLFPESMSLTFSGMVGTATLPQPWGIVSSGGVVVRAHGTQTGLDTTSYAVDFTSLIPGSGTVTAILAASVNQIQQNPYPLVGPPQGHPSFNPNFVPTVAYATTTYSVALSAVTGTVDNRTSFELARTTLTAGQVSVSTYSTLGWQRAALLEPRPATLLASGGVLTLPQSSQTVLPNVSGLTSTLPAAVSGGGLFYRLINPSASTVWTVAAPVGNTISGGGGTPVTSMGIPPYGALTLWGNAASGRWEITGINPLMMAALANTFTAPQTIVDSSLAALTLNGSGSNGVNLKLIGNGSTTPSKTIRVIGGALSIRNDANTADLLSMNDSGTAVIAGGLTTAGYTTAGSASIGAGLSVVNGGVYSTGFDAGGMNFRTSAGTGPGAGFRNDGSSFYILLSNSNAPSGSFNGLRPLAISLTTGAMIIDGTGAGVRFGNLVTIPDIVATIGTIGNVTFPGGGVISTPGAITSSSSITGASVSSSNGNVTANGGRLRATFGAANSGDPNAAVILADFIQSVGGSPGGSYIYQKSPDGTIIQSYTGVSPTGQDFITFPNAFPGGCSEVVVCEGQPQGWVNGTRPSVLGAQQLSKTSFALYVSVWNLSGWALTPGVTYRYFAIGF